MWPLHGGSCELLWVFLGKGSPTQDFMMFRIVTPAHVSTALHSIDLSLVAVPGNKSSPFPGGGQ